MIRRVRPASSAIIPPMTSKGRATRRRARIGRRPRSQAGRWLAESERLFRDFVELTPHRFEPLARSFDTFEAYQRWRRAQKNPWYR